MQYQIQIHQNENSAPDPYKMTQGDTSCAESDFAQANTAGSQKIKFAETQN